MTAPEFPSPNPGGENRRLIRRTVADWVVAQRVAGITHVYASVPRQWRFDAWPHTGTGFSALVAVRVGDASEDRLAYTGPIDPGGKLVHYPVELRVRHWTFNADDDQASEAGENDYDRIVDALKDALRGVGRDLGRPEIVLHAGEWPRQGGITDQSDEPLEDSGSVLRAGAVAFNVTQYLTTFYPGT